MDETPACGARWRSARPPGTSLPARARAWIGAPLLLAAAVPAQASWMRARVLETRVGAAMAYDAARQRVVLFGGSESLLGDPWEWDGVRWVPRNPAARPTPRSDHALAYDSARKRVVLFGGRDGSGSLQDTWEWDGVTWVPRTPAASPPVRHGHTLAYDTARQRVVLFGGFDGSLRLGDTWEWD